MPRPEKIFVVEDDILYLNLINKELEKMGYDNVSSYTTGKEAMHNLNARPDIALLDYFLEKDFTGMDILKKLKQRFPDTQVIFLTASDDVNIAVDTMRNGAYDYIVKGDTAFIRIRHLLKKISEENDRKSKSRSIIRFQIIVIFAIILISLLGILYFHYFIN
jgi:two-component system, OmpR family, response regulator